jgi:parallel beta-helix repeat protein
MSYNGKLISHGCEMYNCVYGYEMSYRQGHTILQQNTVHRADFAGIALSNGGEGMPYGPIIVKDNNIYECAENGIVCVDSTDIVLANNDIVDCGTLDGFSAIRVLHSDERVENVHVTNNRIVANNANLTQGITISAGTTYDASNVIVKDNIVALTKHAVDTGYSLTLPYYYEGNFGDDCIFDGNKVLEYGGDAWEIYEDLLTTTSATNILSIVPGQAAFYAVDVYYRVVTAATNVLIVISFYDQSDTAVNEILVNESSVAVGSYVVPSTTILTNATNLIQVAVTAGTANQVYASAKLRSI